MAEQVNIEDFLRKRELATEELKFDGFKAPFVIKETSNEVNESLQAQATTVRKLRNGQTVKEVNDTKYAELLVQKAILQPDLTSKKLQGFYGTLADPWATLNKMLSVGELKQLSDAVVELTGLNKDLDHEVEDVKK